MRWDFRLIAWLSLLAFGFCEEEAENATTTLTPLLCAQCSCSSKDETMLVFCSNMNIRHIPDIRKEIHAQWVWEMDGNSINTIPAFPSFENLRGIMFRYNEMTNIEDSAFANLTNLEKLDLSHNNISKASLSADTFKGKFHDKLPYPLLSLKTLILSHNHLSGLPEKVFVPLTNLTSLDLSHNPFKDFSLQTASTFTELTSLERLDLSYTELKRLPDHFFAELHKMKYLDLSGNNFISVPPEINYATALKTLKLNNNIFGILEANSFWKEMHGLQELYLSGSSTLFKVNEGTFGNLTGLRSLWLNNNSQLSMLHPRAFVDSTNNSILLENLYLQDNAFNTLSPGPMNWARLDTLDLQRNPWNCDCNFEWVIKALVWNITDKDSTLTMNIRCNEPPALKGLRLYDRNVQSAEFVCISRASSSEHSFILIATIVVGCLLLATGVVFLFYILFKKANPSDWIGENVKYRRAQSDENVSTILY